MTEEIEALEFIMEVREALDEQIAENTLITEHLVTDATVVYGALAASTALLELYREALKAAFTTDPEMQEHLRRSIALIDPDKN